MVAAMVVVVAAAAAASAVPATTLPPRRGLTNVEPPFEIHPSESETRVVGQGVARGDECGWRCR